MELVMRYLKINVHNSLICFNSVGLCAFVGTGAMDCLGKLLFEMTCCGTLISTH